MSKISIYLVTQRIVVEHNANASREYIDDLARRFGTIDGETTGVGLEGTYEVRPDGAVTAKLIAH